MDESFSYSYDKRFTSQSDIISSKSNEEDDYQLNLDNDVENLHVISHISPDMSPSKPKTVARKAQEKLDYFTNNNDRTKITNDDVSNSSVFNKERFFSSQHLQKQKQQQQQQTSHDLLKESSYSSKK